MVIFGKTADAYFISCASRIVVSKQLSTYLKKISEIIFESNNRDLEKIHKIINNNHFLGAGVQGSVYDLGHAVLKISKEPDESSADEKMQNIEMIRTKNLDIYPKILNIGKIGRIKDQDGFFYFCEMEKMHPCHDAETISAIIRAKIRNKPTEQYKNHKCYQKAIDLYDRMEESGTIHIDPNPGNIMCDSSGQLKFVDLDSVVVTH